MHKLTKTVFGENESSNGSEFDHTKGHVDISNRTSNLSHMKVMLSFIEDFFYKNVLAVAEHQEKSANGCGWNLYLKEVPIKIH